MSPERRASASSVASIPDRMFTASLGPTPETSIRRSKSRLAPPPSGSRRGRGRPRGRGCGRADARLRRLAEAVEGGERDDDPIADSRRRRRPPPGGSSGGCVPPGARSRASPRPRALQDQGARSGLQERRAQGDGQGVSRVAGRHAAFEAQQVADHQGHLLLLGAAEAADLRLHRRRREGRAPARRLRLPPGATTPRTWPRTIALRAFLAWKRSSTARTSGRRRRSRAERPWWIRSRRSGSSSRGEGARTPDSRSWWRRPSLSMAP